MIMFILDFDDDVIVSDYGNPAALRCLVAHPVGPSV